MTSIASRSTTLISTVGGQPQVVTFALDTLLERGIEITVVNVLHLSLLTNVLLAP